jgi:outer membrane lipoprotein-sorting protein
VTTGACSELLRRWIHVYKENPAHLKRLLSSFVVIVGTSCVAASAANDAPAITAFDRTFAGVRDYTCVLQSYEADGTRRQERVYQYSFMKPHYLKTLILDGDGKGSGAVWTGGDQVSGHLGGMLSGIHVKINVHDPRALSLHGVTIPDGLLPGIIDDYRTIPGTLTQTDGGKIGSVETDRVDLHVADPSSNHGITEQIVYLAKSTHWPIRQVMYSASQMVLDDEVDDLKINVGLAPSDFPF